MFGTALPRALLAALSGIVCLVLVMLSRLYRSVTRTGWIGTVGLALVSGGAVLLALVLWRSDLASPTSLTVES